MPQPRLGIKLATQGHAFNRESNLKTFGAHVNILTTEHTSQGSLASLTLSPSVTPQLSPTQFPQRQQLPY